MTSCMRMLENMATGGSSDSSGPSVPYFLALWNLVIRPPRAKYDLKELGPSYFDIDGIRGRRMDLRLKTNRGIHLECTYYRPESKDKSKSSRKQERLPVVIYMHGNSSCRLEALDVLRPMLRKRISVFTYDSAGCGQSEGEYVSLGHFEREDLACVIQHLRKAPGIGPIGIWGRSMGAATALMHADDQSHVSAIICDSAFASLPDLMRDIGNTRSTIQCPPWLINSVIALIRMRVQGLAGFDIEDVVPARNLKDRSIPVLFVHARDDNFISVKHTRRLYEEYGGVKECIEIGGDHNTSRGPKITAVAVDFLIRSLKRHKRRSASVEAQGSHGSEIHSGRDRQMSSIPLHLGRWQSLPPPPPQNNQSDPSALTSSAPSMRLGEQYPLAPAEARKSAVRVPLGKHRRHSCPPRELPDPPAIDGVTPRTLPPRGGGTRNPSPWEPTFSPNIVYEERDLVEQACSDEPLRNRSNKLAVVDIDDQENVPPALNSVAGAEEKPHISRSLTAFVAARGHNGSDCIDQDAPLCRLPIAAALPPAPTAHVAGPRTVAEDPEIRPLPSSVQPLLLAPSCTIDGSGSNSNHKQALLAVVESEVIKDAGWCQPRQSPRHEAIIGSPDHKASRSRRRAASFPWLCCGLTPGS